MWVGGCLRIDDRLQARCNEAHLGDLGLMPLLSRLIRVSQDSYAFTPTLTLDMSHKRLCLMIQTQWHMFMPH